jgi:glycosyltransferase involved in cell wall biosynthesis
MKILLISPRYSGGIGGHANLLAQKLRKYGYEVSLMDVPHIPIKNLKNPSYAFVGTMKALLSNEKYDIAHAFNVPSAFVMKAVKAKKRVLSVHGVYSAQVESLHSSGISKIVTLAEPKVLKWADKLTTDSALVKKTYKEKLNLEVELLPSPIDETRFAEIPEVSKIENQVAYVGRDSYEKGIDILRNIESRINGKVIYCTNVPWKEAMASLKASTVLAVPSRMESMPWTIKEAFYLKVPVVATTVGDIPEIVEHQVRGILVPPNNPSALLNAINSLLVDKQLAKKLADNAYDYYVNNLTYEKVLPKYIQFYESLIK